MKRQLYDESLRQQLIAMMEKDLRVRGELAATGDLYNGYAERMAEVHRENAEELKAIICEYGWPGRSLVGEDGMHAAWLILQHAIGNPELQRSCLPLLKEAAEQGEADPKHAAYLEDRICFFERRPQRYGTQFDWDENGEMSPWLLEDPENVDELRRSVGLPPLSEVIARIRKETENEPKPADWKRRQEEMIEWAKSVGWL